MSPQAGGAAADSTAAPGRVGPLDLGRGAAPSGADGRPVLVEASARWCAPCRAMAPVLARVAADHPGVAVRELDVERDPERARALRVRAVPTLVGFRDGAEVFRYTGALGEARLRELFAALSAGRVPRAGPSLAARILRIVAGLVIGFIGTRTGTDVMLTPLGVLVAFTAVYDRCPAWAALREPLRARLQARSVPRRMGQDVPATPPAGDPEV